MPRPPSAVALRQFGCSLGAALREALLPGLCPLCEAAGPELCESCQATLAENPQACPFCAAPHNASDSCRECGDHGLPGIARVQAGWLYRGSLQRLIHRAKAGADPAALACLRRLAPPLQLPAISHIVPIPPTPGRRPGPHLASVLAKVLAHRHGLPSCRALRQTRTAAGQHELGEQDRKHNTDGLFAAVRGFQPLPHVLLVDDLLTSGATLISAARGLRAAGQRRISAWTLARVGEVSEAED